MVTTARPAYQRSYRWETTAARLLATRAQRPEIGRLGSDDGESSQFEQVRQPRRIASVGCSGYQPAHQLTHDSRCRATRTVRLADPFGSTSPRTACSLRRRHPARIGRRARFRLIRQQPGPAAPYLLAPRRRSRSASRAGMTPATPPALTPPHPPVPATLPRIRSDPPPPPAPSATPCFRTGQNFEAHPTRNKCLFSRGQPATILEQLHTAARRRESGLEETAHGLLLLCFSGTTEPGSRVEAWHLRRPPGGEEGTDA
jgi:hypothetical protein